MEHLVVPLSDELARFIAAAKWTFAKTMPEWPHEYIVRQRVDPILFDRLAGHIQAHGFEERYYERKNLYFRDGELRYWVIGNIINRCRECDSYDARATRGELPTRKTEAT